MGFRQRPCKPEKTRRRVLYRKKSFFDADRKDLPDHRHSEDEPRRITIGKAGKILFVVYTERHYDIGEVVRIISARRATEQERRFYYDRDGLFGHEQASGIQRR
ncbi:MAG: BrnT family toxin [Schwartzia sp.]|nr:BrnT family toxin [Schwartzia sp. (in: firmicutes)]